MATATNTRNGKTTEVSIFTHEPAIGPVAKIVRVAVQDGIQMEYDAAGHVFIYTTEGRNLASPLVDYAVLQYARGILAERQADEANFAAL